MHEPTHDLHLVQPPAAVMRPQLEILEDLLEAIDVLARVRVERDRALRVLADQDGTLGKARDREFALQQELQACLHVLAAERAERADVIARQVEKGEP
jgi:hypothetical protein